MITIPARPILESYWVIPGRFLAGEYPGSFDATLTHLRLSAFLELGFNSYIDLTRASELPSYEYVLNDQARISGVDVVYTRFSIRDRGLPSPKTMKAILDTIDSSLEQGRKVYLHCWGGVGRTGTVVGCYLVRHGKTGAEALAQLAEWWGDSPKRQLHPRSPETDRQLQFVLTWKE
jgi:hypothetical protein